MPDGPFHAQRDGTLLELRIQPRAPRSEIVDIRNGALRVRVAAAPVDGAANAAVIELLSKTLGLRKGDLEIVSGERGRRKRVLVRGMTGREVSERLAPFASAPEEQ